ncbi:MAG: hypothetical protein WAN57_05330, partial [Smithella sp.]
MLSTFKQPPIIKNLGVKHYKAYCSLNRLALGVDNIHLDVHISPQAYSSLKKTTFLLMVKNSGTEFFFKDYKREFCEIEKDALKRILNDILLDGINKAKAASEVQIDFLAQISIVKLFLEEIKSQYKMMVAQIEPLIKFYQLSAKHDQNDVFLIKDKLSDVKVHYAQIVRLVGEELFELLADVNTRKLREMRETHFVPHDILPSHYLSNPVIHTNNPNDDFFLIEEYVLMGQRSEDIDNYNSIRLIIYELLSQIDFKSECSMDDHEDAGERKLQEVNGIFNAENYVFDSLIMNPDNINRMFDYFDSQEQYEKAKKQKEAKDVLEKIKKRIEAQKYLLNLFYRKFKKSHLIRLVVADFEMKPVYENYCPPMPPRQVREFLVDFWERISMRNHQKRLKSLYGNEFSLE